MLRLRWQLGFYSRRVRLALLGSGYAGNRVTFSVLSESALGYSLDVRARPGEVVAEDAFGHLG